MISNFVNEIFMNSRLITKFTKILCHENLELYGILQAVCVKIDLTYTVPGLAK